MTENLQQLVDLVAENPILKGSFVEELFQIMLLGEFTDVDEDPDLSCEKVIGKINDLEKALITLRDNYKENEGQLLTSIHDEEIGPDEKKQIEAKLRQGYNRYKIAQEWFWASIHDRFGQYDEPDSTGFGIRCGQQVVLLYDNDNSDNPSEIIFVF